MADMEVGQGDQHGGRQKRRRKNEACKKEEKRSRKKEEEKGHDISQQKIQFGKRVGRGSWLIGPKLFRPDAYPTCVSSKLCEFIF